MANFNFDPSFFMQAYLNSNRQGWQSGENQQDRAQRDRLQRQEIEAQAQRQAEIMANQRRMQEAGFTWQSGEGEKERGWRTGERLGSQAWQSGEGALERQWRTGERIGSQDFNWASMLAGFKHDIAGANQLQVDENNNPMYWTNRFNPTMPKIAYRNVPEGDALARFYQATPNLHKKFYGGLLGAISPAFRPIGENIGTFSGDIASGMLDFLGWTGNQEQIDVINAINKDIARRNARGASFYDRPYNPLGGY